MALLALQTLRVHALVYCCPGQSFLLVLTFTLLLCYVVAKGAIPLGILRVAKEHFF